MTDFDAVAVMIAEARQPAWLRDEDILAWLIGDPGRPHAGERALAGMEQAWAEHESYLAAKAARQAENADKMAMGMAAYERARAARQQAAPSRTRLAAAWDIYRARSRVW